MLHQRRLTRIRRGVALTGFGSTAVAVSALSVIERGQPGGVFGTRPCETEDPSAAGQSGADDVAERHDAHVVADQPDRQLGSGFGRDRRARLGGRPQAQHVVDDRSCVHTVDESSLADRDGSSKPDLEAGRKDLLGEPVVEGKGREYRIRRPAKHRDRAIALVHRGHHAAPAELDDLVADVSKSTHGDSHLIRIVIPQACRLEDLGGKQRNDTRRVDPIDAQCAGSRRGGPAVCGRRAGSTASAARRTRAICPWSAGSIPG